ncbi:hypothetical protein ACTFIY_011935 [Dictyostelium cf. discoideum]
MKYLIFIILCCNILAQSQVFNFEPFLAGECYGVPSGIGYSVMSYKCINNIGSFFDVGQYDYQSWYFGLSSQPNGGFTIYANSFEQENCTGESGTTFDFGNGYACTTTASFVSIDATFDKVYNFSSLYSYVTISKYPQYTDNSVVYEVFSTTDSSESFEPSPSSSESSSSSGSSSCKNYENFLYATYVTNGLEIDYKSPSGLKETYTCDKDIPIINYCAPNKKCYNKHIETTCNSKVAPSTYTNIFCSK